MPTTDTAILKSVTKALYNLCDEDNYNVYDNEDIAGYLGLDIKHIEHAIEVLLDANMLDTCMTYEDDGITTYCLKPHAIDMVTAV